LDLLQSIFFDGYYADKAIEYAFKNHKQWGSKDRRFIAETTYDMVRYWRRYWHLIGSEPSKNKENLWRILTVHLRFKGYELPDWKELQLQKEIPVGTLETLKTKTAIWESYPDWMAELLEKELGPSWAEVAGVLNTEPPVFIRVNTLKTTREKLKDLLLAEEIEVEPVPEQGSALKLVERQSVFRTDAFQKGLFEVQDLSSQKVADFCGVEPKMKVVDACAGAGGKSLHLATAMGNKGKVISLDTLDYKLKELRKRASRNGIDIIEVRPIEGTKTTKRLSKTADRVLLDVPCTGLGVVRRNPDTKWKLKPEEVATLHQTQKEILDQYSAMVKPGGQLIYSTCSLLPSENRGQIDGFLSRNSDFTLDKDLAIMPTVGGGDGFYMARMIRKG
jgi:16S rRNA (cytosine967-C5)-methyltransferase